MSIQPAVNPTILPANLNAQNLLNQFPQLGALLNGQGGGNLDLGRLLSVFGQNRGAEGASDPEAVANNPGLQNVLNQLPQLARVLFNDQRVLGHRGENAVDLDRVLPVVTRALRELNFGECFRSVMQTLDSNALANVSIASIKASPYAFWNQSTVVQGFDNGISARLRFAEAGFMAVVSGTFNIAMAVLFGVVNLVTLTRIRVISDLWKKHFVNAFLSYSSVGIAFVGTIYPRYGCYVNTIAVLFFAAFALDSTQAGVATNIARVYQQHRQEIRASVQEGTHQDLYQREVAPFLDYLDRELVTDKVHSFAQLFSLIRNKDCPMPDVQVGVSLGTVRQCFETLNTQR